MPRKLTIFLGCALSALALDQLTKFWVVSSLHFSDRIAVVDGFFYITHVRNPGAAFSLFANAPEDIRTTFFVGISLLAVVIIVSFYRKLAPGDRLSAVSLGLILGGALGNLVDRLRFKEVVDFLHFRLWSGYSWPDFNLADSFIVVGVGLLVLELLIQEGESRAGHDTDETPAQHTSIDT